MHVVKIGSLYLTNHHTFSASQRDARRFDTFQAAKAERDALIGVMRPVKLKARTNNV